MFAFSVLYRLDLLTDSSCDNVGLRKYLSSLRKKLSREEISHFSQMLTSLENASGTTHHDREDLVARKANSSPIHESQKSKERDSPIISPRDESISQAVEISQGSEDRENDRDKKVPPVFNKFKRNRKR